MELFDSSEVSFFTFCIFCACAFICMPAFCFFLLVGMELQFWRQFCVDVCFCVFVSGVGIFVNFIQEARFCFWLYAPPAKRLCTFASPCTKIWESVSSRDLHICTFGRDVYLHLTLIGTLQINKHHYIVTNMEIQHYTLFCDCLCNKSPAESSSPPPFSFLEEIFPFGKSRFPPFVFCQLAAARKKLSKRIEEA